MRPGVHNPLGHFPYYNCKTEEDEKVVEDAVECDSCGNTKLLRPDPKNRKKLEG